MAQIVNSSPPLPSKKIFPQKIRYTPHLVNIKIVLRKHNFVNLLFTYFYKSTNILV